MDTKHMKDEPMEKTHVKADAKEPTHHAKPNDGETTHHTKADTEKAKASHGGSRST